MFYPLSPYPACRPSRPHQGGTVLLLTIMMLVLLTFEVAVISLVAQRGLGEEGMLQSQHSAARRGGETVLNQLENALYTYLQANDDTSAETAFNYGGSNYIAQSDLMITPPGGGADIATDVKVTAWVSARRGVWYKLTARAQDGSVDLLVHRWIKMNPCKTGAILTQILPVNETNPGYYSTMVSPVDDRVFFGENAASGYFWTWHKDTGLSTITPAAENRPGVEDSTAIASDGRVYFGEQANPGQFWTWHQTTGLSTLLPSNAQGPGWYTTHISPVDGRVFFAENASSKLWTYKPSTGLSTIGAIFYSPGDEAYAFGSDGTYYFGDYSGDTIFSWNTTVGLSTVAKITGVYGVGTGSLSIAPDGRLYFGQRETSGAGRNFWTWKSSTGLSTVLPAVSNKTNRAGYYSTIVDSTSRVLFSAYDDSAWGGVHVWTYHPSTGLTTLVTNINSLGAAGAVAVDSNDRFYFSQAGWGDLWTWKSDTGLSTITVQHFNPGGSFSHAFGPNNEYYFGAVDGNNTNIWRWHTSTGLSTVADGGGQSCWGCSNSLRVHDDGRVAWGARRAMTWSPTTGLSTMGPSNSANGYGAIEFSSTGGVYFGSDGSKPFYYWEPPEDCNTRGF